MCLLAIYKNGRPSRETLEKQERGNPHGAGLAWFGEDGVPRFQRGLTGEQLDKLLDKVPAPIVYHFRLASVGAVSPGLTHPFVVGGGSQGLSGSAPGGLLFHNGHVSEWKELLAAADVRQPGGLCSDTRAIAAILSGRGIKKQTRLLSKLSGRFALLRRGGVIKRTGQWFSEDGGLHSNLYWLPSRYVSSSGGQSVGWEWSSDPWPRRSQATLPLFPCQSPALLNQPSDPADAEMFNSGEPELTDAQIAELEERDLESRAACPPTGSIWK